jgi:hypothetical protein
MLGFTCCSKEHGVYTRGTGLKHRKKITCGTAAQCLRADADPMLDAWTWRAS